MKVKKEVIIEKRDKMFNFFTPIKIKFGSHSFDDLLNDVVGKKVFIVIDQFLFNSSLKIDLDNMLKNCDVQYFYNYHPNPDITDVEDGLHLLRQFGATTVIGIGGGSSMDVAKFLAAVGNGNKGVREYLESKNLTGINKIKSICIPTTAGTGSEVTNVSVFTDNESNRKSPFVNDNVYADVAILDPCLTITLPASVTASSGIDSFCHAIEAYWNINSNPISDSLAKEAMKLVVENLKKAVENPNDLFAREHMLYASLIAGIAFAQTRTTILHAISFRLTTNYHIPHGEACAVTLPYFIKKVGDSSSKMKDLAVYLGMKDVNELSDYIKKLMTQINLKTDLESCGVKHNEIHELAEAAMKENIAKLTPIDINEELLEKMLVVNM